MNDFELDQLLESAQTSVTPHVGFQREVWMRIEAADAKTWKSRMRLVAERFFSCFALPPVALATCSAMLAAGVWIGLESANPTPQGQTAYIQSISPFAQTHR